MQRFSTFETAFEHEQFKLKGGGNLATLARRDALTLPYLMEEMNV